MAQVGQPLARNDSISRGDDDRAGLSVGIDSVPVVALDDDEVAGHRSQVYQPARVESPGVLEKVEQVPDGMDGIPLRPAVLNPNDNPGRRGEDGLAPTEIILQANAEEKITERAGPVITPVSAAWL